jgi:hypothetical protein
MYDAVEIQDAFFYSLLSLPTSLSCAYLFASVMTQNFSKLGGLTCRWQRHSVKPSCRECSTIVEQAETHVRVVVPIEEEEEE